MICFLYINTQRANDCLLSVGLKVFKRCLYRIVDSDCLSNEDQERLREIERRVFDANKEEILKKENVNQWTGSIEMNRRADFIVATKIRTSFRVYESSNTIPKKSYFNFSK